ncbi:ISL3 family transposase [Vagococcus xieshaowenii]|uniref:ISL3 family transposase n=1 Tax=Vagococcus xieshaowenii TaxID=2562451 RepID=A0ABX5TDQ9_9ENTE|nr:ISL3 family transposase [Vagococcus xieshaowenii]QCA28757.1 ISL3 family transposase [Vagococcus xieshaowenii]
MDKHTRKLLGLEDKNIYFAEDWLKEEKKKDVLAYIIEGVLTYRPTCCEKCGELDSSKIVKNGYRTTKTQLPPFRNRLTYLKLHRSRFRCYTCGATFIASTPIVERNHHISRELNYQIMMELKRIVSRKDIAERYFVSDVTVLRTQRELAKQRTINYNHLPSILCIDEFKSMKSCEGSMSFICVDGVRNKLFVLLEDRRLEKLASYFMKFSLKVRKSVKYLVMDMNGSYAQLIKKVFPCAEIVTDRFHIVQHINRSFNQLRINIMNTFRNHHSEDMKKYRRLKRYWKLLLKDTDTLDNKHSHYHYLFKRELFQQEIIDELLTYDERLRLAYDTIQLLHHYRKKSDVENFFHIINDLSKELPNWFRKKLTFFNRHNQGIYNALILPYSNGITEGINNKIKLIKRVSYGYRNFRNLRDRIYISQGLIFQNII